MHIFRLLKLLYDILSNLALKRQLLQINTTFVQPYPSKKLNFSTFNLDVNLDVNSSLINAELHHLLCFDTVWILSSSNYAKILPQIPIHCLHAFWWIYLQYLYFELFCIYVWKMSVFQYDKHAVSPAWYSHITCIIKHVVWGVVFHINEKAFSLFTSFPFLVCFNTALFGITAGSGMVLFILVALYNNPFSHLLTFP